MGPGMQGSRGIVEGLEAWFAGGRGSLGGSRESVFTVLPVFILSTVINNKCTFSVSLNSAFENVFGLG